MLTNKEINRMDELEQEAVSWYLDKTDFNPADWMDKADAKEYVSLIKKDEE